MKEGYVYVLINASLQKNILKIGMTRRNPEARAEELSEETGLPSEYIVAYERKVSDCETAEMLIHKELKQYRITYTRYDRDREFFKLQLKKAIPVVNAVADQFQDSTQNIPADTPYSSTSDKFQKARHTDLEWAVGPDRDMDWNEAKSWVKNLNLHEGGWKMPTLDELKALYINERGMQKIRSLLKTSLVWVWSGEKSGPDAWYFHFARGQREIRKLSDTKLGRTLAVRQSNR